MNNKQCLAFFAQGTPGNYEGHILIFVCVICRKMIIIMINNCSKINAFVKNIHAIV